MVFLFRLFFSFTLVSAALPCRAQISRENAAFTVGYQYANFGYSLSAAEIRKATVNAAIPDGGDPFTNGHHAIGAVVHLTTPFQTSDGGFALDFTLGNKRVSDRAQYSSYSADSSVVTATTMETKIRLRYLSVGAVYARKRLSVGASMDLGIFATLAKYSYDGGPDAKWEPWFSSPKISGSGVTGKSPVIGATFSAGYLLTSFIELRAFKQITLFGMGGSLSDRSFSIGNWGVELAFRISPNN